MSLVIGFVGSKGAVMAGDTREIVLAGEESGVAALERELYSGEIATDEELQARAEEMGVEISIDDAKNKITHAGGVLIGEVTSREGRVMSRRRLYATTGAFAIVDFLESGTFIRQQGGASRFVVLGSEIGKRVAGEGIVKYWKGGGVREAIEAIMRIMKDAADRTATVSGRYVMIQTSTRGDIAGAMRRDGVLQP